MLGFDGTIQACKDFRRCIVKVLLCCTLTRLYYSVAIAVVQARSKREVTVVTCALGELVRAPGDSWETGLEEANTVLPKARDVHRSTLKRATSIATG
ncbi:hypothetical protein WOLCODRAFT_155885 [Wolfiporia cocos MD-104 SS10]|uniref:Uncharacterized protein n=1 Tax=Wolfiporia cocos (strain MD-104) TaxID=742152 RepID=A0A2H3IYZ0_WOLCO|nr:hypothetical protein WOLCODRAFT_155885 [Wolfiporia cocos MD-104 SS10]